MEDDPVQFPLNAAIKGLGVLPDAVDADVNVGKQGCLLWGKLKGDDVGIGIVVEVGFIDIQEIFVCAKDVVNGLNATPLKGNELVDKLLELVPVGKMEGFRQEMKKDVVCIGHISKFVNLLLLIAIALGMNLRLSQLKTGERGIIEAFESSELELKLMEMGCIPGEEVVVEQRAPLGDPISIRVAGYSLSLRINEANQIIIAR